MTHDLGLFREFERRLGSRRKDWYCVRLKGNAREDITFVNEKTDMQKAEEYLAGYQLDEAAQSLRKAAEKLGKRYRELLDGTSLPPGEFLTLTENLRAAKNRLLAEFPTALYEQILNSTPVAHRNLLLPANDDDIDNNADLEPKDKGILKCQRRRLRQFLVEDHVEVMRRVKLIDDLLACTARVLNPGAHAGDPPLYESEIQNAIDLIRKLEDVLQP